jgi:hypothetical protein
MWTLCHFVQASFAYGTSTQFWGEQKMSQTSQNVRAVVTRFERHMDVGSVSVHFYIQPPTLDVGTSIPALVSLDGTDDDIAKQAWNIVAGTAFAWIATTTVPILGREFVAQFQPPPPEIFVDQSQTTIPAEYSQIQDILAQSSQTTAEASDLQTTIPAESSQIQDILAQSSQTTAEASDLQTIHSSVTRN